jgi:hypothetical protein
MMSGARLVTSLWVAALLRRAEAGGVFGAVLRRGDPVAGAIAVVLRGRDGSTRILARLAGPDGSRWADALEHAGADSDAVVAQWVARQARYDPDLWVIELLGEDAQRFVVELPRGD